MMFIDTGCIELTIKFILTRKEALRFATECI
jgi:hypothetical protein